MCAANLTTPAPSATEIGKRIFWAWTHLDDDAPYDDDYMLPRELANVTPLAAQVGKSTDTVKRWINGEADPGIIDLYRIHRLTGRELHWFAGDQVAPEERLAAMVTHVQDELVRVRELLNDLMDQVQVAVGRGRTEAGGLARREAARRTKRG